MTLVVIGYSFPLFNRIWDNLLIEAFGSSAHKEKKIYVQSDEPEPIISRINNLIEELEKSDKFNSTVHVIPVSEVGEFFVPNSFSPVYDSESPTF